jgi:hypothetical protein
LAAGFSSFAGLASPAAGLGVVLVENGHPPEPPAAPDPPSSRGSGEYRPPPAPHSFPGAAGSQPAPASSQPAPAPPPPGPVCGLKELPEGADPADWEWVEEGGPTP